ncbi:MAG: hypothetical protein UY73_C0048G0002 [Parcubacteria group bacterium GW2011_GWA2_52_8]|nr:MAG: hypothetical protein UY73_C0048G0002 [Parcubacteria group bacterium GW2011_GWA2_52_8]
MDTKTKQLSAAEERVLFWGKLEDFASSLTKLSRVMHRGDEGESSHILEPQLVARMDALIGNFQSSAKGKKIHAEVLNTSLLALLETMERIGEIAQQSGRKYSMEYLRGIAKSLAVIEEHCERLGSTALVSSDPLVIATAATFQRLVDVLQEKKLFITRLKK